MKKYLLLILSVGFGFFLILPPRAEAAYGDTATFLGRIYAGDGGEATAAFLDFPEDLAFDLGGNLYIADTYDNVIRKVNTAGIITTHAGTGSYGATNGDRLSAEFGLPKGVAVDSSGNIYVADTGNNLIRKINLYGSVSTLVSSGLNAPEGLAAAAGYLYIADTGNNQIKKYNLSTGALATLTTAISSPKKMDINADGSFLYVADSGHYRVVKVATGSGAISVIAGSGTAGYKEGLGTAAQFRMVYGIGLDRTGNALYVTDEDSSRIAMIRKIDLSNNQTSRFVYDTSMTAVHIRSGIRVSGNYIYLAGTGTIHRYNKNNASDNSTVAGSDRFGYRNGSGVNTLIGRPPVYQFGREK
jgi:DNA-binding beta-propeller fold protein YncE